MRLVWKYPLELASEQTITVPILAKPLTAQMQDGVICIWLEIEFDLTERRRPRKVFIVGTGYAEVQDNWHYAGSVQDGPSVWHVYVDPE